MTDDRTLAAVDERGRAAAAGIRTAVAEHPVPAFDPDVVRIDVDARPEPRRRPVIGLLATAAAGLVVVAAVVALVGGGEDDSAPPTDRVAPGELQRFVLAEPPDRFAPSSIYDASEPADPLEGETVGVGPIAFYGSDPSDPALGVYGIDFGVRGVGPDPVSMPTIDVGGRTAWRGEDATGPGSDLFVVVDDVMVTVIGAGADEAEIRAAAGAVVLDGDRAVLPADALPDGWEHLGDLHSDAVVPGVAAHATTPGGVGWAVGYHDRGGEGRLVAVVVAAGTVRSRIPAVVSEDVAEVDVGEHRAVVAQTTGELVDDPGTTSITWEERPGEIVQVIGSAEVDQDVLVGLARDLRPVGPDGVPDLRRAVFEAAVADPRSTVVGRGSLPGGTEWGLLEDDDDGFPDLVTLDPPARVWSPGWSTAGGSSEEAAASPFNGLGHHPVGEVWAAFGGLDAEVAEVEIRLDGSDQRIAVTVVEGGGHRGWVAELPSRRLGELPAGQAIAHAADGTELGRLDLRQEPG